MMKHSSSRIPTEIIGILLGNFIDDYTINVTDVFGTPHTGDNLTSEALEDDFQHKMMQLLTTVGHKEQIVGWYDSHPGTGLWLSAVAVNTQMNQEKTIPRSIAIVVDTIQSVKERLGIGAFRCIDHAFSGQSEEIRATTSFVGHLEKPTTKQLVRGLNSKYYRLPVTYTMHPYEQLILESSLIKGGWESSLMPHRSFAKNDEMAINSIKYLIKNFSQYKQQIKDEVNMSKEQKLDSTVGKNDPCASIKQETDKIIVRQINQLFLLEVNSLTF